MKNMRIMCAAMCALVLTLALVACDDNGRTAADTQAATEATTVETTAETTNETTDEAQTATNAETTAETEVVTEKETTVETQASAGVSEEVWNQSILISNFDNVTFGYSVAFIENDQVSTTPEVGVFLLDGDKAMVEGELADAETVAAIRTLYVETTLAIVQNYRQFSFDQTKQLYVSAGPIVYEVHNVTGYDATITVKDVEVELDENSNIARIVCHMTQDFKETGRENGEEGTLVMNAEFTLTDYGTTVVA